MLSHRYCASEDERFGLVPRLITILAWLGRLSRQRDTKIPAAVRFLLLTSPVKLTTKAIYEQHATL